jgi:murein DD-endopeptidase MepM/ murein hydrolase activator NlpD
MTLRPRLHPLLPTLVALATLALAVPASSPATEPAGTTQSSAPAEGTAQAPALEAPATPTSPAAEPPRSPGSAEPEAAAPQVQAEHAQGTSPSGSHHGGHGHAQSNSTPAGETGGTGSTDPGARAKHPAPSPATLTPSLPLALRGSIAGVPDFFIESFQIPPFLLPIFQAAGTAYRIPWQVLAAINEVETDYGRDLSVSSAGAEGWMQFLPAEWAQYGVDANGDGFKDPYNPSDAIFTAARYLRAAGGDTNVRAAVFSYNHSQQYVESVMLRAQLLGGTPSELLGAITGLTEAHFPVHAASHFSDGFPAVSAGTSGLSKTLVGTTIYSQAGAPVVAVQDGEVVRTGESPSLGRFVALRDAYGNTYVYSRLGDLASVYPVLQPRVHTAVSSRISSSASAEPAPHGPATAGAQARSPFSEGATVSGLSLGAAAGLESAPSSPATPAAASPAPKSPPHVRQFSEGSNEVYLHPLVAGVQVIAGTVLGHVGAGTSSNGGLSEGSPHILFQIRPAGLGAPLIDPKPILDGWVALENTSIFRAKGENPFLATSPSIGQVLLESKQQLEPQVLHDHGVRLASCARQDVQEGRVDKRVLSMLEYLSVSGLKPTVAGLPCAGSARTAEATNAAAAASSEAVQITAVNGVPVAGHQGPGSIADTTVRRLLMLQGLSRPRRIVSQMRFPGAAAAIASPGATAIRVTFGTPTGVTARAAGLADSGLTPSGWIRLIARLGEIPDPTVGSGHSAAAIADSPKEAGARGGDSGNH